MAQLQSTVVTGSLYISGSDPKVGIGTTNPGFKLQVATPTESTDPISFAFDITRENSTSRGLTFGMSADDSYGAIGTHNADLRLGHTFGTETNGQPAFYPTMTIQHVDQTVGKVGIGTTSPNSLLHIDGDMSVQGAWFWHSQYESTSGAGVVNGITVQWRNDITTLNNAYMYKVRLTTAGTGTNSGATYIVNYNPDTTSWEVRAVNISGNTSNHPLLVESSGTLVAYTNHSNSYPIRILTETYLCSDNDGTFHNMGADFHWQRSVNNLFYNDGNVGIGTSSPSTKFEVRKDNSDTTLTAITSGNDTISLLNETDTTNNYTSIGFVGNAAEITARIASVADASNGRGNLVFLTGDSTSGTPAERMRIDSSGRLFLGTATIATANAAADDFVIKGEGTAIGMTISNSSDAGTGTIFFGDSTDSAAAGFRYNHNTGDMAISAEDNITITADRVGIGTTTPAQKLTVDGTISGSSDLSIDGDSVFDGTVGYNSFNSGFGGNGWRIDSSANAEFQNLTVRGTFSVYELLAQQVRATNGSLLVATSGKVDGVDGTTLLFDSGSRYGHGFAAGDVLISQRLDPVGGQLKRTFITVDTVANTGSLVYKDLSGDSPEIGQDFVRIGNTGSIDRQGHIYLTADDTYAPYIGVRDGLSGSAQFVAGDSIEKVRVGKLDGITSSTFGSLSGYGFWATGNAYLEGGISATFGSIGGFGISADAIFGDNFFLSGSATGNEFFISSPKFNIKANGDVTGSQVLFTGGDIGGFSISQDALSGDNFYLSGSATGNEFFISSSDFNVKANGDVTASSFLFEGGKITGDVTFLAPLEGSTAIYYDDFSIYPNASAITSAGNSPKIDGSGQGYSIFNAGGLGEIALVSGEGELFGKSLKLGNNSGNDEVWLTGNRLVPFNSHSLYELEVRAKNPNGSGLTYVGITAYASNGTTKVNASGADSFSSQHYFTLAGDSISSDYTVYKGYFKGVASSGNGGKHSTKTDPGTIHVNAANGFITPLILANYNDQTGDTYIDYVKITEFNVGGGSTVISGDTIKTGTIKSNNLSTTLGTQLALDDGEMRIGGTGAYTSNNGILLDGPNAQFAVGNAGGSYIRFNHTANKIEINTDNFDIDSSGNVTMTGTVTANAGQIGGFAITDSAITGSGFFLSGSATGNEFFISASNFNVKANGDVTASNANIEGRIVAETGELRDLDVTGTLTMTNTSVGTITNTAASYIISSSGIFLLSPSSSLSPETSRLSFKATQGSYPTFGKFDTVGELYYEGNNGELILHTKDAYGSIRNNPAIILSSSRDVVLESSRYVTIRPTTSATIESILTVDSLLTFSGSIGSAPSPDVMTIFTPDAEGAEEGGGTIQDGVDIILEAGLGGYVDDGSSSDGGPGGNLILKAGAGGPITNGSGNPGASGSIQMFGNVGIGTSSPDGLLNLAHQTSTSTLSDDASEYALTFNFVGATNDYGRHIAIRDTNGDAVSAIGGFDEGTGGATGLYFATGNTTSIAERMRIDSSGNVGIGTTSPANDVSGLHISVASSTDQLYLERTDSSTGRYYLGAAANSLLIVDDAQSAERMRIDASGNVGIGTTSPSEKLEVTGNLILDATDANIKIKPGGTGTKGDIQWTFNTDSTVYASAGIEYDNRGTDGFLIDSGYPITMDFAGSYIRWQYNGSEKMRLNSSGNLGIGTTSPGALLELKESSNAAGDAVIRLRGHGLNADNTVLGAVEWFNADSSGDQPGVVARVEAQSGNANGHMGELVFKTHDGSEGGEGSDPVERMRIDATGNVGIGTSSPSYELAVRKDSAIPELAIEHFDTPSDNDTIGSILFRGNKLDDYDTASVTTAATYAQIRTVATDITDISADSKLEFRTQNNNTLTTGMSIEGTDVNIVNDLTVGGSINGTISPSGNLSITGGNVVLDSGQGIDFSATGQAGGMTSELLDDYEEGTWTPQWVSNDFDTVVMDTVNAHYTKIGNLVTISAYVRTDGVSVFGSAANAYMTGLPFTPVINDYFAVNVGYSAGWSGDAPSGGYLLRTTADGTRINFHYRNTSDGSSITLQSTDFDSGTNDNLLMFSIIYYT